MIEGVLAKSGPIKLFARIVFECLFGNTSLILQVQVQGDGLLHVPGCTSTTSCSRSAWAYSSSGESDGSGLALSPRNPECDHHSPPPLPYADPQAPKRPGEAETPQRRLPRLDGKDVEAAGRCQCREPSQIHTWDTAKSSGSFASGV